jgi:hypothetical protein
LIDLNLINEIWNNVVIYGKAFYCVEFWIN